MSGPGVTTAATTSIATSANFRTPASPAAVTIPALPSSVSSTGS